MNEFRESLWLFAMQMGFMAILGIALAITAIAQALPWIILAGAIGLCLISVTLTGCAVWLRSRKQPTVYIIQPGQRAPRLLDDSEILLQAGRADDIIENPKGRSSG